MMVQPLTAVIGCVSRSVRDTARWLDVCNGFDPRDPYSLPRVDGWEAGLGSYDLRGKRVAIVPNLGTAFVHPQVEERVVAAGEALAKDLALDIVEIETGLPAGSVEWALAGLVGVLAELGDLYPECERELTPEIAFGLRLATQIYNLDQAAKVEEYRIRVNERMAAIFEQVDFVIASTNPDVAFAATGPLPTEIDGRTVDLGNNGALTIPSNIAGNPAVSIPIDTFDGLPVGLQILGPHHREALLLDLALTVERERPWPLVAPGAPI